MRLAAARLGWASLCLVPLSMGIGRFWYLYVAPGDGIPYAYRSIAITPTDVLVVATCIGWLGWHWRSAAPVRLPRGSRLVVAALTLLVLAALASIVSAFDQRLAAAVTVELAVLVLFFVAMCDLLGNFPRRQFVAGIAVAIVAQALLAGWQAVTQSTAPAGFIFNGWTSEVSARDQGASVVMLPVVGRWLRSYGSFPHPNILGGFLALALVGLALAASLRTISRRPEHAVAARVDQRLHLLAMAAGGIALLLTFSRAAWLGILLAGVTFLIVSGVGRVTLLARATVRSGAIAVAVIVFLFALVRIESLGSLVEQNSIQTRAYYDNVAWSVIAKGAPVGAGNLVIAQQHLLGAAAAGTEPAHNVFVIALAELGPVGVAAWLAVIASLLVVAWWRRAEPRTRTGPLVAVAVIVPLLLFDHYLWTQSVGRVLLVFTLALLTSVPTAGPAQVQVSDRTRRSPEARHEFVQVLHHPSVRRGDR